MIRSDREITDLDDICRIITRSKMLRLGLNTEEGWPYVLPLSFGFELDGRNLIFYVHGAQKGLKWDLADRDNRATVELDNMFGIIDGPGYNPCQVSTAYDSVIALGIIEEIEDDRDKASALASICGHYRIDAARFDPRMLEKTRAYRIRADRYTAKRNLAAT